jgi:hypothetical protein
MYRGILGDCFLLIYSRGPERTHILIDCGVLQGTEGGKERMRTIVADLLQETGKRIDLVVLTHEHADHLSGFAQAHDLIFAKDVTFGALWLAWTENDLDPQAVELHARFTKAKKALALTAQLTEHGLDSDESVRNVAALRRFVAFMDEPEITDVKRPSNSREVIAALKAKAGPNIHYLEPGDVRAVADEAGFRAFVLGPPRDLARLRKDLPSHGPASEVYLTTMDEALAVTSSVRAFRPALDERSDLNQIGVEEDAPDPSPFAKPRQSPLAAVQAAANGEHGWVVARSYFDPDRAAEQIDRDWLRAAEALALKMDSDTNNTSLALAFELPDRQVLLFPGDAQVGNWLSWGDQTYPRRQKEGEPSPILVDDLLNRVTLYKVGHHASHNATLRHRGLEEMKDDRLIAMIPVVREVAQKQGKDGWDMPYGKLEKALLERTKGRVLRGDDVELEREREAFEANAPATLRYADQANGGGLWVEVELPIG